MFDRAQFVAGRSGELGIQRQYLDGELHLVDNALAGRLHFAPEFEIVRRVIQAITVFVMHVFAFAQRATEQFFHKHPVLVRFFAASKMKASVSGRMYVAVFVYRAVFAAFVSAFNGAKTLRFVVPGWATFFGVAPAIFFGFSAEGALKRRWWFMPHEGHLLLDAAFVKENV